MYGVASAAPGDDPFPETSLDYAHNLLIGTGLRRLDKQQIGRLENIDLIDSLVSSLRKKVSSSRSASDPPSSRLRAKLRAYVAHFRGKPTCPRLPRPPFSENILWLANALGLSDAERAVLMFSVVLQQNSDLREITMVFGQVTTHAATQIVAAATAMPESQVREVLRHSGRLIASRLLSVDATSIHLDDKFDLKSGLADALLAPGLSEKELIARFLPAAVDSALEWSDVEHVDQQARLTRALLAEALRTQKRGVNVLFYGATGTGKTALATMIAKDIGVPLYVAEEDAMGEDRAPFAKQRLSSLSLGQCLLRQGSGLMVFDELEDLFQWGWNASGESRGTGAMSKMSFNKLLETNPIPTIWISNRTNGIDPAFLRRFMYVVEFRPIGMRQRARILTRHLGQDSALASADIQTLASRYAVSPAQIGTAVAAARLVAPDARPDRETLENVLVPTEKLVRGSAPARSSFDAASYNVGAVNASEDLRELAEQAASWSPSPNAGLTMCLYGPPGTGKSEYVRYLAHRMGRPVLYRSASDILGPYVGQTEMQIAAAFQQAEDDGAVLLFDEVDSFLRDRRGAYHSWEVTQVNEFLQQMEACRGVVVCTTNLWREIDEAALRRFVIKVEFRYLLAEQAVELFAGVFADVLSAPMSDEETGVACATLRGLGEVTPGDFAVVARRARSFGRRHSVDELLMLVSHEAHSRRGAPRRVGFEPR